MRARDRLPNVGLRPVTPSEGSATLGVADAHAPAKTSRRFPFEVAWVPLKNATGRLGLAMAPGRQDRTADAIWRRDLHADLRRLRYVHRIDALVSLVAEDELEALGLAHLHDEVAVHEFAHLSLPVRDGSVPTPDQEDDVMALVADVVHRLTDGETVVLHCRAGQGRSGTFAAIALAALGERPSVAIERVREAVPRAVETVAQEAYVATAAVAWARRRMAERAPRAR